MIKDHINKFLMWSFLSFWFIFVLIVYIFILPFLLLKDLISSTTKTTFTSI
jgi:hypothetical protein